MDLEDRDLLVATAVDLFTRSTPLLGRSSSTESELGTKVWRDIEEVGLGLVGVAVERGGAGGGLADACAVLRAAARFAPPMPLAETQPAAWPAGEAGGAPPPPPPRAA